MEIRYKQKKLEKMMSAKDGGRRLQKLHGVVVMKKAALRLSELRAAANLAVMERTVGADLHPLKGDRKGQFAVRVSEAKRLVFSPAHRPIREDGGLDLGRVTEIVIEEIVDYHG